MSDKETISTPSDPWHLDRLKEVAIFIDEEEIDPLVNQYRAGILNQIFDRGTITYEEIRDDFSKGSEFSELSFHEAWDHIVEILANPYLPELLIAHREVAAPSDYEHRKLLEELHETLSVIDIAEDTTSIEEATYLVATWSLLGRLRYSWPGSAITIEEEGPHSMRESVRRFVYGFDTDLDREIYRAWVQVSKYVNPKDGQALLKEDIEKYKQLHKAPTNT